MAEIKYTNQRIEILNYLKENYNHPTVEQVYCAVKNKLSRISKATVYQNLRFLADKGLIQEVNIKGVSRFEPNLESHHHIICKNCGKIMDFDSKELTEFALKLSEKVKDMRIESTSTNFYGVCKKCKGSRSNGN